MAQRGVAVALSEWFCCLCHAPCRQWKYYYNKCNKYDQMEKAPDCPVANQDWDSLKGNYLESKGEPFLRDDEKTEKVEDMASRSVHLVE